MVEVEKMMAEQHWIGADGNFYTYSAPVKKICATCRQPFDWDGSEFKNNCTECYRKLVRKCLVCKVNNLKLGAPKWQTSCVECYLKKNLLLLEPVLCALLKERPIYVARCPSLRVQSV